MLILQSLPGGVIPIMQMKEQRIFGNMIDE